MLPAPPEDSESSCDTSQATTARPDYRRLAFALLAYAALAAVATVRLDGKPRMVVWLFLGLFAVKTLLMVLKQRAN